MHELGITQGIIDRAREAAVANDARKVAGLYLVMTPAADFSQDSIEMYFEMLTSDDELFKGAALHFEHRPVAATCLSCSDEFSTDAPHPIWLSSVRAGCFTGVALLSAQAGRGDVPQLQRRVQHRRPAPDLPAVRVPAGAAGSRGAHGAAHGHRHRRRYRGGVSAALGAH